MVIDTLTHASTYGSLGSRIERAFTWLRENDVASLSAGRHEIDGDAVFALVQDITTKPAGQGVWEAHRRYLDIQAPVTGDENIGYAPIHTLEVTQAYDEARDYCLLRGEGTLQHLRPGMFALLLPQDAHMPGIAVGGPQAIRKVVVKVLV